MHSLKHLFAYSSFIGVLLLSPLCGCDGSKVKVQATAEGSSAAIERVLNAETLAPAAAPQMVEIDLFYKDGSVGLCSGVAVGTTEILTATHCFAENPIDIQVRQADSSLEVIEIIAVPGFRSDDTVSAFFNDVAVIRTTPHGLPAYPILRSSAVLEGEEVLTLGFGIDESGGFGTLKAGTTLIDVVTSNHLFSTPFYGDTGVNPCFGDSGGPALVRRSDSGGQPVMALAGLVSSGTNPSCLDGDVTLFTSLQQPHILEFLSTYVPSAAYL